MQCVKHVKHDTSTYTDQDIQVGNEFGQVEGLWSQFENVMAKDPESATARENKEATTDEQA